MTDTFRLDPEDVADTFSICAALPGGVPYYVVKDGPIPVKVVATDG